jgi:hypothetical protein
MVKICISNQQGSLEGLFRREQLDYRENYAAEILQINISGMDKDKPLSVQKACTAFGGHASCSCQGVCSKIARCSGREARSFCTSMEEGEIRSAPYSVTCAVQY